MALASNHGSADSDLALNWLKSFEVSLPSAWLTKASMTLSLVLPTAEGLVSGKIFDLSTFFTRPCRAAGMLVVDWSVVFDAATEATFCDNDILILGQINDYCAGHFVCTFAMNM